MEMSASRALTNMPASLPQLIDREEALAESSAALAQNRLLTLTGPGGCGKTRLALHLAASVATAYPDGVWLVELGDISDAFLVPATLAAALGVREQPGHPLSMTIAETLREKRVLIVLDNCEHLIAASARLAETLLQYCRYVHIVATSREALNIPDEYTWVVPALSLPECLATRTPTALVRYGAIQLFVKRATAVLPGFALTDENATQVAMLCQRLDGVPLAIELAAARMKVLSIEQILAKLDEGLQVLTGGSRTALPRQQTLQGAIAWSYDLLTEEEQAVFRQLAIAAGDFGISLAEALGAGAGVVPESVLELLAHLVDKSLVVVTTQQAEARYAMLETIRAFGQDRLRAASEEEAAYLRYGEWVARQARATEDSTTSEVQRVAFSHLCAEVHHLRAVMHWLVTNQPEIALQIGTTLLSFWMQRGDHREGRRWLETALRNGGEANPPAMRALALHVIGALATIDCEHAYARLCHEQSLEMFRELGDQPRAALALTQLAFLDFRAGKHEQSIALLESSLVMLRDQHNPRYLAMVLHRLGITALGMRDFTRARGYLEESLTLRRWLGNSAEIAVTTHDLGVLSLDEGHIFRAQELLTESLTSWRQLGDLLCCAYALDNLGEVLLKLGDPLTASAHFREALILTGNDGDKIILVALFEGLAKAAQMQRNDVRSLRLWASAEGLRRGIGAPRTPSDQEGIDSSMSEIRQRRDETACASAWVEGKAMSLNDAFAYACAEESQHEERIHKQAEMIPSLRIMALGTGRVERDGQALTSSDWTYAKARELLYYLLSHRMRTKEQIGLALWPDASPEQLRANFRVVMHHLRHALGHSDRVLFADSGYSFNRELPYWYDVEVFERRIGEGLRLRQRAPEEAAAAITEALALYQGDFLEGAITSEWMAQRQDELVRLMLDGRRALGQIAFQSGNYAAALDAFLRITTCDAYNETAHRGVIACYLRLGEHNQAIAHYQSLRRRLKEELGTQPDPATTALLARPA